MVLVEPGRQGEVPEVKVRILEVPAVGVTSLCFAGSDRRDLIAVSMDNTRHPERAGSIFRTRVDVAGTPIHPARI